MGNENSDSIFNKRKDSVSFYENALFFEVTSSMLQKWFNYVFMQKWEKHYSHYLSTHTIAHVWENNYIDWSDEAQGISIRNSSLGTRSSVENEILYSSSKNI